MIKCRSILGATKRGNGWKDLLTPQKGQVSSADTIGNLADDGTWNYTWEHERQLACINKADVTIRYANDDGAGGSYVVPGNQWEAAYDGRECRIVKAYH